MWVNFKGDPMAEFPQAECLSLIKNDTDIGVSLYCIVLMVSGLNGMAIKGYFFKFSFEQYSGTSHHFGKIPQAAVRGSKRGSYIQIWRFCGKRKCPKRSFLCFTAEQP